MPARPLERTGRTKTRQVRSCKDRLRPNRAQTALLDARLRDFCGLYNACLQQRVEAYRRRGISRRYAQQAAELKACRTADPDGLARWSFSALQQVLRRLDQTFTAFLKRVHGFPRHRACARHHAATLRVGDGLSVKKDRRIGVVGVPGGIKAVWHRDLPPDAKLATPARNEPDLPRVRDDQGQDARRSSTCLRLRARAGSRRGGGDGCA
ncbi:hypothetical protein GMJLKIPL_6399 [Methylobacterium isbiliense]|jgi:putative transposase|uniref:Transposase putative helix-turn-helix domain-containing protein n=1 Tax=Methylobacterium isbiliense TaxID=315478 RepID=A0ABQ4SPK9_9HYPH|nr:hypothetical protein GMJLKIPL_6399 [Methylobacterium isbiliense]